MATGTLVLAVTAIFATKANKKFTTITTAVVDNSLGNSIGVVAHSGSVSLFTTIKPSGSSAQLNLTIYASTTHIATGALVTKTEAAGHPYPVFYH